MSTRFALHAGMLAAYVVAFSAMVFCALVLVVIVRVMDRAWTLGE